MLRRVLFLFPRFSLTRTTLILRFPPLAPRPLWRTTSRGEEGQRWNKATPTLAAQKVTNIATQASIPVVSPRQPLNRPIPLWAASQGDTMDNAKAMAPLALGARILCSNTTWTMSPTLWSTLLTNTARCTSTSASTQDVTRYMEYSLAKLVHKIIFCQRLIILFSTASSCV